MAVALGVAVFGFLGLLAWAALLRIALHAAPPGRSNRETAISVIAAAAALAILQTAGLALAILPGLVIAALGQFAMLEILRAGAGPASALLGSVRLALRHPAATAAFTALGAATLVTGILALGVGIFPAMAILALAQARLHAAWTGADLSADVSGDRGY